jgi:hypothetical protein
MPGSAPTLTNRSLRVRAKINSQILSVEAPAGQGAKAQEYQAYSELSQRRLREPLPNLPKGIEISRMALCVGLPIIFFE